MSARKNKKEASGNLAICLGIVLLFIAAFVFLIDRQYGDANTLGDIVDNDVSIRTIEGRQLVVRDMNAIYPKYFVVYFDNTDDTYIVHSFNFYQTDSQYELEFRNHLNSIVDYNYNEYMIRYVYAKGEGSYQKVLETISFIVGSDNIKMY